MSARLRRKILAITAATAVVLLGGCYLKGALTVDEDGRTRAQTANLSLEEQYAHMHARYEQMHLEFADAQRQITSEPWTWISYGLIAESGITAPRQLAGSGDPNRYYLDIIAAVQMPDARGLPTDLEPMLDYFDSLGLEAKVEKRGDTHPWWVASAVTKEGNLMIYRLQPSGYYGLSLYSPVLWGDSHDLSRAIGERIHKESERPLTSVPGEIIWMPEWSDPPLGKESNWGSVPPETS